MTGETFDLGTTRVRVVVATDAATVLEVEIDAGGGAPPHVHTREDETIAVLAGRLAIDDGTRHDLGPGDAYVLARGVRHSFANPGEPTMRALFFCAPGGLERFFREAVGANGEDAAAAADRAGLVFG